MTTARRFALPGLVGLGTGLAAGALMAVTGQAAADEALLAGAIKSAAGEKMGGVTVSAKAEGQSITTSVFTDEAGAYYFPALPAGKYHVWAQALAYQTAKGEVDLTATRHQDFVLRPLEDFARQLPGDRLIAALPEATEDDRRTKRLIRNDCTRCHRPRCTYQHRFDDAAWHR